MKRLLPLLAFAILPLFASTPATPVKPASSKAPVQAGRSDAEILAVIRTKLAKSKIGKDGFTVTVKSGVATWEGSTDVMQHKGAATRMAKSAGAVAVVNHIKVSAAALEKARGNLHADLRRAQVKTQ